MIEDTIEQQLVEGLPSDTTSTNITAGVASARTPIWRRLHRRPESYSQSENLCAGSDVGGYIIEELLSHGGFATVYKARHPMLQRAVALKILHSHLLSASGVRRFQQEAQAVNVIRHPNVVDIHDVGEWRGRPFFAMEWLDGADLEEELHRHGQFNAVQTLAIMEDVCGALAAAHKQRVIHRDLKAANVVAVPAGDWFTCKLIDFGVAKRLERSASTGPVITTRGARLGTPTNMAPEQILGGEVDERTDVYALGVLVFHLLTGRLPFLADSPRQLEQMHLRAAPPKASELVDVSPSIDAVIARCMQKNSNHRPRSVDEVLAALRRVLGNELVDGSVHMPTMVIGLHADFSTSEWSTGDLKSARAESREACGRASLALAIDSESTVLGVAIVPSDEEAARALKCRILGAALQLRQRLARRATVGISVTMSPLMPSKGETGSGYWSCHLASVKIPSSVPPATIIACASALRGVEPYFAYEPIEQRSDYISLMRERDVAL